MSRQGALPSFEREAEQVENLRERFLADRIKRVAVGRADHFDVELFLVVIEQYVGDDRLTDQEHVASLTREHRGGG